MNWYRKAKFDNIYNIYMIISNAPERVLKDVRGNVIEIKADSSEQARFLAKKKYTKLVEWEDERAGRTLVARLNKEKTQEIEKYRETVENLKRKREERAQGIYEN